MIYLQANEWLLAKTKALRDYENRFFMQSGQYRDLGIDKYFEFHCKVYYPSMRSDLDNSLKILLDCLQKCKAIKNDNLCVKVVAEKFIDKANPKHYFLYTIITKDMNESYERISHFRRNKRIRVQAQPYRDLDSSKQVLPQWQKDMARWANRKEIFKTVDFKDYVPRKGFICNQYFNQK
jgi:hypothetical protein